VTIAQARDTSITSSPNEREADSEKRRRGDAIVVGSS
jgi:hypothetical protein